MSYLQQDLEALVGDEAIARSGDEARWRMAWRCWRNTGPDGVGVAEWTRRAAAVGVHRNKETWRIYRQMWEAYGSQDPRRFVIPAQDWTDGYYELIPTNRPEAVRERFAERQLFSEEAKPEDKREAWRRLSEDPVVVEAVATPGTAEYRAARQLDYERDSRMSGDLNRLIPEDAASRALGEQDALTDLQQQLRLTATSLRSILPRLRGLPDSATDALGRRELLLRSLAECEELLGGVRTFLTTGRTDLDAFLAGVLQGGH